jgi:Ca2+-binding RTX toxin-like protein
MATLVNGLGGVAGFGENQLERNDDDSSAAINIAPIFGAAGINFFGSNYTEVYVNNNGNITFGESESTYTPYGMQNSYLAMIAPFFADVDTRGATTAATPGGTSKGTNLVHYDLDPTGYGTLTVTWDDVGYFSEMTDKLNAFQLQLVGKGNGNFDVIYRYETINWTTGDASGGSGGLGGTVARAGYSTGDGTSWYELPQSGNQSAILDLETTPGNTGVAGYYKFSIVSGTSGNDNMQGTAGNDSLYGSSGNDTIRGLAGEDVLYGGGGADTLFGGSGNDTYIVDAQDTLFELANEGVDTVQAGISHILVNDIENLVLTGSDHINATGNGGSNTLFGNSGNNVFNGAGGFDYVSYGLSANGVTVDLSLNFAQFTGQGSDTFVSIEGVIGTDAADSLTGNALANFLAGGAGIDVLNGGAGNDVLNGGAGNDTMTGGEGSDIYYVDSASDVTTETNAVVATGGDDTIYSELAAYTLGTNLENLRLLATGAANGTGNALNNVIYAGAGNNVLNGGAGVDTASYAYATAGVTANLTATTAQATGGSGSDTLLAFESLTGSNFNDVLTGNAGANVLSGLAGNDVLNGAAGNDTLVGGDGADTYYVDSAGDVVSETNAVLASGGNDTVYSYLGSYALGANVENLRLLATGAANGTGNGLNNLIYAGAGNNVLNGGAGVDTASYAYATAGVTANLAATTAQATGGSGSDTLLAFENLTGSSFNDALTGNAGANVLSGLAGNDVLNGAAGNDTLVGGDGSDIYFVDSAGDVVSETNAVLATGGSDMVYSYLATYTLGANVENLRLLATGTANGTGNALSNLIYAGAGNNVLNGGAGVDTASYAYASAGVTANLTATTAQATGGSGSDTLLAFENLVGSNFNDVLTGNVGANVLNGLAGNDSLTGGVGKDTLVGGVGADRFNFNALGEMGLGALRDLISDFKTSEGDKINLSAIDARAGTVANDAFSYIGAAAFSGTDASGQLRFANGVLYGSTDADAAAEFEISLVGVTSLAGTDLIA